METKSNKKARKILLGIVCGVLGMSGNAWAAQTTGPIVIGADGTVTYNGGDASTYSSGNFYAINKAGEFGDTVLSVKTTGSPANPGTSITYTGIRGIDNGESTLIITSMPDGIDIQNNGWIGAINQQSSDNTSGFSNLDVQGIGDIKVKATDGTYGAKGIGIYSAKNTDITQNKVTVGANSLYVESVGGDAYAIQGTLAGRTTKVNIANAVTVKAYGKAYITNFTEATPQGKATLNFGSVDSTSTNAAAYGFHNAGGSDIDITLDGNMTVTGATSAVGFRAARSATFDLKGKDGKEIDITLECKTGDATGAHIGGNNSTAKLTLDVDKFTLTSAGDSTGIYLQNAGTTFSGTVNELSVSTTGGGTVYGIYAVGGSATIADSTTISATGGATNYAVYAVDGGVVNLGAAGKTVALTGDVVEARSESTKSFGTINLKGTVPVDGAVDLNHNQSVTAAADSYSLTQIGTDATDTITVNGNVAVSGEGSSIAITGKAPTTEGETKTYYATVTGTATAGAGSTLNLSNVKVKSLTNNGTANLEDVNTTDGWTLAAGSVTNVNSLTNGTDMKAMSKTGTINGTVYALSGTLDLRGVDLRLKGEPTVFGGTAENPTTLDTLKASRVLFGDIYDGSNNLTIKNIVLENNTTAYCAALGVYYDSLTVDKVSVNADEGWYWDQQYNPYNYQMYTGFGGTLTINKSLTTGEYMNAGYSVGGTGITNLADGAVINCVDFQNTGNMNGVNPVSDEVAAQNIAAGIVHVNGTKATLNAAALNNHAITTLGTVNLTSHSRFTTPSEEGYSVNYGTGAVLTIGTLNFLNKQGDTTKNHMRFGDNAKTIIGGLTTNPDVGADFYVTETSDMTINKNGGNAVKFTGDIVFTTYNNATSDGTKVSMNLDSSDDYFTGAIKGTVSEQARWGKWGSGVKGDEVASTEHVKGMTLNMSNGATWTMTGDSAVNNLTVDSSAITKSGNTNYDLTLQGGTSSVTNSTLAADFNVANDAELKVKGNAVSVTGDVTLNGKLNLKDDSINTFNVDGNFTAAQGSTIDFDADITNNNELSDKVAVTGTVSGNIALGSVNIAVGDDLDIGTKKTLTLFTGNDVSNLTISGTVTALSSGYVYSFVQDTTDNTTKGNLVATKTLTEGATLPDVIQNNNVGGYDMGKVKTYALTADYTTPGDLGTLTRVEGENTRELTINGNDHELIGNNKAGVTVNVGDTLTLKNLKNVSGFAGTVVNNSGTTNIENVTMDRTGDTTVLDPGLICNSGANAALTIENSSFTNVSGKNVLYADNGSVTTIKNSSFVGGAGTGALASGTITANGASSVNFEGENLFQNNSKTDLYGGAIMNYYATLNFKDGSVTTFDGNSAGSHGGAVLNGGIVAVSNINFEDGSTVIFKNNTAGYSGGAIVNTKAGTNTINFASGSQALFDGNQAKFNATTWNPDEGDNSYGGAIYNRNNATLNFSGNSVFVNNTVTPRDGTTTGCDETKKYNNDIHSESSTAITNFNSGSKTFLGGGMTGTGTVTINSGAEVTFGGTLKMADYGFTGDIYEVYDKEYSDVVISQALTNNGTLNINNATVNAAVTTGSGATTTYTDSTVKVNVTADAGATVNLTDTKAESMLYAKGTAAAPSVINTDNSTVDYEKAADGVMYALKANEYGTINVGEDKTQDVNISVKNTQSVPLGQLTGSNFYRAVGVMANNSAVGYEDAEYVNGKINITGDVVTIKAGTIQDSATSGAYDKVGVVGIYAQSRTADPVAFKDENRFATINIDANETHIELTEGDWIDTIAINNMSQGRIYINGSLYAAADAIIASRGYAKTVINKDGTGTVQLTGNIEFDYDSTTSGTKIDSSVDLNLTNSDSYWTGKVIKSGDITIPEGKADVTGMSLTLKNGATWNVTGNSFVNYLTMDNGIVDMSTEATADNTKVEVDDLSGTKAVVKMDADNVMEVGTSFVKELNLSNGVFKLTNCGTLQKVVLTDGAQLVGTGVAAEGSGYRDNEIRITGGLEAETLVNVTNGTNLTMESNADLQQGLNVEAGSGFNVAAGAAAIVEGTVALNGGAEIAGSFIATDNTPVTFDTAADSVKITRGGSFTAAMGSFENITTGATYLGNTYDPVPEAKNAVKVENGGTLKMRYNEFTYYTSSQYAQIYGNYQKENADYILTLLNGELKVDDGEQLVIKARVDNETATIASKTPVVVDDSNNETQVNVSSVPETYVQVVQNEEGRAPELQSASTINIKESTFAAKGLQVKDTGTEGGATVNVNSGSTITLVGDNAAGGSLVKDENNQAVRTKIIVEDGAVLNVGMKENTQEQKGTIADIEVQGDHTLDGNGAMTTEYAYGTMTVNKDTTGEGNATVQILNASGTVDTLVSAEESTIYLDPSYMNVYAVENNTVSGSIYVSSGSVLEIGFLPNLRTAVEDAGFTTGDAAVGFTVDTHETVLALGGSYTLAANAELIVDSAVDDKGADANNVKNADVFFGPRSLLVVNGQNHMTVGMVAVTMLGDNSVINVADTSKLYVQNAKLGETYYIVKDADDENSPKDIWWNDENLKSNKFVSLTGKYENGIYIITTGKGAYGFDDTVIRNTATAMTEDTSAKASDHMSKLLDYATWNGDAGHAAMVAEVNKIANMPEELGVMHDHFTVSNMAEDAVAQHLAVDTHKQGKEVWAQGIHSKESVSGLGLDVQGNNYETQYNGAIVGVDLVDDGNTTIGAALTYVGGKATAAYGSHNDGKYYGATIYGRTRLAEKSGLQYDVSYMHSSNDLFLGSGIGAGFITGDQKVNSISVGIRLDQEVMVGKNTSLVPHVGARWLRMKGDSFNNSLGDNYSPDATNSFIVPAGLSLRASVENSGWKMSFLADAGYQWNFGDRYYTQNISYNGAPDRYDVAFADRGNWYTAAGFELARNNFTAAIGYRYLKSNNTRQNRWNLKLDWKF